MSAFDTCPPQKTSSDERITSSDIFCRRSRTRYAAHKRIPVSHHWKDEGVKRNHRASTLGNTKTKWCARIVVVPKKNGSPPTFLLARNEQTHSTSSRQLSPM